MADFSNDVDYPVSVLNSRKLSSMRKWRAIVIENEHAYMRFFQLDASVYKDRKNLFLWSTSICTETASVENIVNRKKIFPC